MDALNELLLTTLRAFIRHEGLPPFEKEIISVAKKHNVHNIIACAYRDECSKLLEKLTIQNDIQVYAYEKLVEEFETAHIQVLPLKGICTKLRYANPLYRTMGDIDLLIKPEQNIEVRKVMKKTGYEDFQEERKHDHYTCPPFLSVEVHRTIEDSDKAIIHYYEGIWKLCKTDGTHRFIYRLNLEDEYVMNMVHLMLHFKKGGIGIRFMLDVYTYEHLEMDMNYVARQFTCLGIVQFYHNIRAVAENWFGDGAELDETQKKLADYIADGGTFGAAETNQALSVSNGRIKYLLGSCFPSYRSMETMFPWLHKRAYLLPLAWGIRGFRALFYRRDSIRYKLKSVACGDKQKGKAIRAFYKECGL